MILLPLRRGQPYIATSEKRTTSEFLLPIVIVPSEQSTVEPLYKGQVVHRSFVPCREAVLSQSTPTSGSGNFEYDNLSFVQRLPSFQKTERFHCIPISLIM